MQKWTDAEYEVVGVEYRPGDRHRNPKLRRWAYTGRQDAWGRPLWYRPPILNRWLFGAVLGLIVFGLLAGLRMLEALHR